MAFLDILSYVLRVLNFQYLDVRSEQVSSTIYSIKYKNKSVMWQSTRNKNSNMKQISLRAVFLHSSRLNRVPRYCQETRYLSPSGRVTD